MRPRVDSLIVHGNPNPQIAAERADAAYGVFWNQSGKMVSDRRMGMIVVATGGGVPGHYNSNLIVRELKAKGVPKEHIEQEFDSRDTLDNIRNGVPLCQGNRIGFVSNRYHLKRAKFLFEGLQGEGFIDPDLEFVPVESKTRFKDWIYESAAFPMAWMATSEGYGDARLNNGGVGNWFGSFFYHNGDGNGGNKK